MSIVQVVVSNNYTIKKYIFIIYMFIYNICYKHIFRVWISILGHMSCHFHFFSLSYNIFTFVDQNKFISSSEQMCVLWKTVTQSIITLCIFITKPPARYQVQSAVSIFFFCSKFIISYSQGLAVCSSSRSCGKVWLQNLKRWKQNSHRTGTFPHAFLPDLSLHKSWRLLLFSA